jgi:hypothetical protein
MITYNKIGLNGRFGNQMFQYATLYSIAKTKKYNFGVPYSNRNENEYQDFCLPDCFPNLSAKDSSSVRPRYTAMERNFEYNPGIFGVQDNTDIVGYFQSEKYFVDYKNDLLKEFEFNEEIKKAANDIRSLSKKEAISVHLRLGDYVHQQQNHPVCTIDYYVEALNQLPDDLMVFAFSDDNEKAKDLFTSLGRKVVIADTQNKFIDMCTMTMCEYHVIANSSFSWWGAWLSPMKKVYAPARWFGSSPNVPKNWSDIYCKDWIVI